MKKRSPLHQFAYDADVDINEVMRGNTNQTISKQTAIGVRMRKPHLSPNEAMDAAHGNMLSGAGALVAGAAIIEKNPILGIVALAFGMFKTIQTVDDWQEGDYY